MPKIDKVLLDLVKEEAAKLREALKPNEASMLNFYDLNPKSPLFCIYGQATGNCYSPRASELIIKCCKRVYKEGSDYSIVGGELNGKPNRKIIFPESEERETNRAHYSPIEVFIILASNRCKKKLIQYLRKEVETLDL